MVEKIGWAPPSYYKIYSISKATFHKTRSEVPKESELTAESTGTISVNTEPSPIPRPQCSAYSLVSTPVSLSTVVLMMASVTA